MINTNDIKALIPDDDAATESERMFLYALILALKPKVAVEIGTHKGLTAVYMACALKRNGDGILHTTDPHDWNQKELIGKFPDINQYVKVHREKGEDLEVGNVDFLFIDGFHEEKYVLAEFKHFLPKLTEKAVVIFHDCGGDNELVGVNSVIKKLGLETAFLPTENKMRIYGKFKP